MKFSFGKNWISYSDKALNEKTLMGAQEAFDLLFNGINLPNQRFLDIGFGQGLSLILAAQRGAEVFGFDLDEDNLQALLISQGKIKKEIDVHAEVGSILDENYILELSKNKFDIVHSWGVLHHTGDMATAVKNSCKLVSEDGYFVCAIYNKHITSPMWKIIKWGYNILPEVLKKALILFFSPVIFIAKWWTTRENPFKMKRGMDYMHNVVDWVGGYPYEYASIDEFVTMVSAYGFECIKTFPAKVPTGCNEFVFKKT